MQRSYIGVAARGRASRWHAAKARVALASRARTWELALFADNLTDKHYAYTGGTIGTPLSPVPTIAWNIPGARRTAGLEGTYRWNPAH